VSHPVCAIFGLDWNLIADLERHSLPFLDDPDVAMGIAVKTFLDDTTPVESFPAKFIPFATAFAEDLEIAFDFFGAVHEGVKTLSGKDISGVDKAAWDKAAQFLVGRRKGT
jgi:hypothetical protein